MPQINSEDTIAALSTPPGEGGIAVIRVSGKQAISIVSRHFSSSKNKNLKGQKSHTLRHGHLKDEAGNKIDEVLVGIFLGPQSYTGEDVVEISCHGGVLLTRKILDLLFQSGARPAEPGEFTRRAFLHGKIDLTQAEAVLDLIRARSDASLAASLRQLEGGLSKRTAQLKENLMKIYAHLEAGIDFPDERLEVDSRGESAARIKEAEEEIGRLIASFERGARLKEGVLTVIIGRPNVGKSSLLNALLERDYALVSEIPGTTRDALEAEIQLGGVGLRLVDTAGLQSAAGDPLERMGMERTRKYLSQGDLFLFLVDGSAPWSLDDEKILEQIDGRSFLPIVNKADLAQKINLKQLHLLTRGEAPCFISCTAGTGIEELEKRIRVKVEGMEMIQEGLTVTRLRHKQALQNALESLERTREGIEKGFSPELVLVDLKESLDRLRELIGEVYSEGLLDIIFQEFCIGK